MLSPRSASRLTSLALCVALAAGPVRAAPTGARAPVTPEQAQAAVAAVRTDPLLGTSRTERKLHWKTQDDEERPKPKDESAPWLVELVRWLSESARWLMWLLGAIALAVLAVLLRRWILVRADTVRGRAIDLPSHVRDLDIRPESLPDDIAAAARALWRRGEQRACLSLLYRGGLSRLVHGHAVPIRAASTEGECVQLAERTLPEDGGRFFRRLVQAWLLSVYGARSPGDAEVFALCDEFDRQLPAAAVAGEAGA
ncbi:MAG TPA: DUF4129 domain-containing protein [Albitalea sp.]|nr:DUF4129 domain-containing protein [Albitalea sp.]